MKLFTSNYARFGNHPNGVSISVNVPRTHPNLRHCPELAPTWDIVNRYKQGIINASDYVDEYLNLLEARGITTGEHIAALLCDGDVLLCYEKATDFCHRQIVAAMLKESGFDVVELRSYNEYNDLMI